MCSPAIGKNAAAGQQLIMPFMIVVFLYNGFVISSRTAPSFMKWALYISPLFWGLARSSPCIILEYGKSKSCVSILWALHAGEVRVREPQAGSNRVGGLRGGRADACISARLDDT